MVDLLAFVSTPDRHPGGSVCLKYFADMKKRSHEFVIKEEIKIRQHLQSSRAMPAVFIKFCAWTETYKEEKGDIQNLHEILIPTHLRSMNLKTCTRIYGKNFGRCAF